MGFCCNFDSCFQWYRKAWILVVNSMFVSLCEFFVIFKYDEMNCNIVFGVFKNVF
jgi:hypothetical protein